MIIILISVIAIMVVIGLVVWANWNKTLKDYFEYLEG